MSEPIVQLKNVTRTYTQGDIEVPALRGVDLSISPEAYMKSRGTFKATGERTINPAERTQRGEGESSDD